MASVAGSRFALRLERVREIARGCWPSRLPRAPFGCLGALTVRGELVPLLDLGVLAGVRRPARGDALVERLLEAHLVILEGERALALLVDRVNQVLDGEAEELARQQVVVLDPDALVGQARHRLLGAALARAEPRS